MTRDGKANYEIWFEVPTGIRTTRIRANSRKAAIAQLKLMCPSDHGADGEIEDENGRTWPLDW